VVAAVKDRRLEVNNWMTSNESARCRLQNSLLHRWHKLPRNRATEDLAGKHNTASPRQRLHPNPAIAELPMTSRLLLVSPLRFGLATNRLAVRHLRRLQHHLRVVTLLQLRDNRLNVRL